MGEKIKKAVVLLSGGLDSCTCMAVAQEQGYELYPMSFDYSQRHDREVELARQIGEFYKVPDHKIVKIGNFGGSALTDKNIDVPDYSGEEHIPVTYVPARNLLFLSYALGYAEVLKADAIFIGVSSVDYSGYPDCRPEFIEAFQNVADVATVEAILGNKVKIETPLISLTKADTIKLGLRLGAPYQLTTSCYRGGDKACGHCDSCTLRLKGFEAAGFVDPIEYE
ncbi:MAG: 7-cyano-7-deazaguanine synthase QueC [Spirochaetales bacterium]|nr:7-cyano-7-deazaguanine synthase QueC [Spirochaetales bacterium]